MLWPPRPGADSELEFLDEERNGTAAVRDAHVEMGVALAYAGLERLRQYISRPLLAVQCRVNSQVHTALQLIGFVAMRELVHMRLNV